MKNLTSEQRKNRILARGEFSNHSHVMIGDCEVTRNNKGEIFVEIGNEGAILRHILEKEYVETGKEVWTEEHGDVSLKEFPSIIRQGDVALEKISERTYKFIQQQVFDPLTKRIEAAID